MILIDMFITITIITTMKIAINKLITKGYYKRLIFSNKKLSIKMFINLKLNLNQFIILNININKKL